jgi:hypothetical protein
MTSLMRSPRTSTAPRWRRLTTILAGALLAAACSATPEPPAPPAPPPPASSSPRPAEKSGPCDVDDTTTTNVMAADNWAPITAAKWRFPGTEAILAQAGAERPGPRRPFEYALLTAGSEFGSVRIDGEVQLDSTLADKARDAVILFGHRSDTQFYYVHLSSNNKSYAHNGIFIVDNADRRRIDAQWNAGRKQGAPPAIPDQRWHRVRVQHCADLGTIAVYLDGSRTPLMTAKDTTFTSGRVGFGSFDNTARLRNLSVAGSAPTR